MHGELNNQIRSLNAGTGDVLVKRVDRLYKFDFSNINLVVKICFNHPTTSLRGTVLPINTGFSS